MDPLETNGNGAAEALPPPPPVPEDVVPEQVPEPAKKKVMRVPMARRGLGTKGQKAQLLTNHFKVNVSNVDGHFFHYSVALFYEDGRPVDGKGVGRKVLDRVHETYDSELAGKEFAYDGEKSLFTIGALPRNKLEFTVVLEDVTSNRNNGNASPENEDKKRMRRQYQSKTFKVELSFAAKIPMQAIAQALRGQESENSMEALRVLDIILRQHAAKQGCLLVRQSFFHNDVKNFADVGGGVLGCRGFHSSFRTSQGGLSLNIDVSTTMIIQPGPVVDFLINNQNVKDPYGIDWSKAKRTLKNLRVKTSPTNAEYKITGLSEKPCKEQLFSLKQKTKNENGEPETVEVTVYDYFVNIRKIDLRYSGDLPCINVGRPKRPTYIPLELCSLVSLQRYTKSLTNLQRASLVEKSRQKPLERMRLLTDALKINNYDAEPLLKSCGISISSNFTQMEDDGIMRELLLHFYVSSAKRKPDQIIIFRDGVSESQFNQVLNIELDQIIEACKFLDDKWCPKSLTPWNDFYMCEHAGMIGTRPTHYHVLYDEIGFSADDLQELVHSLSYVYQRSTTAISVVAPICYAHLAATQVGQFMKFEDHSETSSSHGGTGVTSAGAVPVPQLPKLQEKVANSMFFC